MRNLFRIGEFTEAFGKKGSLLPFLIFIWMLLLFSAPLFAQISPGKLSSAHAELEGISNCTACHDLGKQVSSAKCLDCHKEINQLIISNKGYHAHTTVKQQECFVCHSEHHGRKFDALRFDEDNFDHNLTGYQLEGKHEQTDCRECHQPDYIVDFEIKQRANTFLGLSDECLSCHEDYHQKSLPFDCMQCHDFEAFAPASYFDHDDTDYPLRGGHVEVDCIECHKKSQRNGQEFQEFAGLAFNDCVSCHEDPHEAQLPGNCSQCHTVHSFQTFVGETGFNHNQTNFTLKGSHNQVSCYECHTENRSPLTLFQDQKGVKENDCIACHEDHHEGLYGADCARCHREKSWLTLNDMSFFDHSITDYPLEGKHIDVECVACHEDRFSTPIDFSACQNCHEDYHNGEFAENGFSPDCIECHALEQGFEYTLYTLGDHQESQFPLEGAHMATPCFACHVNEEEDRWTFANLAESCVDCHDNIHKGYISESYYPEEDCKACHNSESWDMLAFDHDQTGWVLDGKHVEVACRACHYVPNADSTAFTQLFKGMERGCISCHENIHGDEFAVDGVTDCLRCHVTTSWLPEKFDHNTTRFPLEGRHAEVDCRVCHEIESEDGSLSLIYKLNKFECVDCHQ